MNKLDFYTKVYASLNNLPGMPIWLFTPFRRLVRFCANKALPKYLARQEFEKSSSQDGVIISFTSFPARIDNVWQVVECMFRQTVQPAKILLWLSKEQFPTRESIPESLRERENDIFEIRMVDSDICSHKKYYYVAKEFPYSLVFLIDDDIYYRPDILELSLKAREKHPDAVICNYGSHIGYNEDGSLKPYNMWKMVDGFSDADDLFFGSGGGTLFCPSELHQDLTDIEKARRLTPIADDIWLNAMVRLARQKIVMIENNLILPIYNKNNTTLSSQNLSMGENDRQLENVMKVYGDVFKCRDNTTVCKRGQ